MFLCETINELLHQNTKKSENKALYGYFFWSHQKITDTYFSSLRIQKAK